MYEIMFEMIVRIVTALKLAIIAFWSAYIGLNILYLSWFEWEVWRGKFPPPIPIFIFAVSPAIVVALFCAALSLYRARELE